MPKKYQPLTLPIGTKIIPIAKSTGCRFDSCSHCKAYKKGIVSYLIIKRYDTSFDFTTPVYYCGIEQENGGNYFLPIDVIPYPEPITLSEYKESRGVT